MSTENTSEWREEFDNQFKSLDFNVSTGFGAVDLAFNMKDEVKKFIQKTLDTHSAHLVERTKKELLSCVTAEGENCYFLRVAKDSPLFDQAIDIIKDN